MDPGHVQSMRRIAAEHEAQEAILEDMSRMLTDLSQVAHHIAHDLDDSITILDDTLSKTSRAQHQLTTTNARVQNLMEKV